MDMDQLTVPRLLAASTATGILLGVLVYTGMAIVSTLVLLAGWL